MSSRNTVCRLAALAWAASSLPSCGGGTSVRPDEGATGDLLKISYFRVNPEPKTKRPEPTYRVVMSETWRQTLGESPKEPFGKAAPSMTFKGFPKDQDMTKYVRELRDLGIDRLVSRNPDDFNPIELHQRAINPQTSEFTRVITVGTDKAAKSYFYPDQQSSKELIEIFYKCEIRITAIMAGYTIKVSVEKPRTGIPDK